MVYTFSPPEKSNSSAGGTVYARDMLNTLLRLTFWYEDEADPVSREVRNLGLFYP